jgi:dTDP-4-dehydrorhamnose reductase
MVVGRLYDANIRLMKVSITGASGVLGTALVNNFSKNHKVYATSRVAGLQNDNVCWDCFDLTNLEKLKKWLIDKNSDVIIHCAAIVDVDKCENNELLAIKTHVDTTKVISNYAKNNNKILVYISTDSVFDGEKNGLYTEEDRVNPLNIYAKTKLSGERFVLSVKKGIVIRTNIIGRSKGKKSTFAEWVLKGLISQTPINLFEDVIFSPLHVIDLSNIILKIINIKVFGLYNVSSATAISKYKFGLIMSDIFNLENHNIIKSSINDKNMIAERPNNMGLSCLKISAALNEKMPAPDQGICLFKQQYNTK